MQHTEHGTLQRLIDALYRDYTRVSRLDAIIQAASYDLNEDLLEIVELLPPGMYTRQKMCDQINSALMGHGWGRIYGTVH